MAKRVGDRPYWLRYAGIGFEFVAALAVFAFIGYWVDRKWDTGPWGLVGGAVLGLVGGMYNLIRESLSAFKPPVDRASKPPSQEP